jgi:anaerobic magnesium-protoporphyrin IX monomethyl ester cyclase
MKVLLVKPHNRSDHIQPSLGLGYLAAAIRKDHDVRILDCIKEGVPIGKFAKYIKDHDPDVLGLQCYTFDIHFIKEALKIAKSCRSDMVTVIGGPHPSAEPDSTMEILGDSLDYLFMGEAEIGFLGLLKELQGGGKNLASIPGLVWNDKGSIRKNPKSVTEDLDSLGIPAWDLIQPQTYPEAQHGAFFRNFPIAPIMVTRGCPYPCTFCAGGIVAGKRIRKRSVDSVIDEILMLKNVYGIKEFHIIDDNFTMDREYAKTLLRRLKELDLGMSWAVPNGVRMETLDEELLNLMKETGLYLISLGIESGSDKILKFMKKGITTEKIRECIARIDKCGIDTAGFFILGFPTETEETIRQTIDFSVELPLKRANFFTYLPFPGTESYEMLVASGEIHDVDWEKFYFTNAAYVFPALTRNRLKALHRIAFAKFFLRPHIIVYHIKSIMSFRHFLFLLKRFFHWVV